MVETKSPSRRGKGKGKERASEPSDAVVVAAGPSKPTEASRKKQSSAWDCIPIARSEVSRVPPVWSKDGRFYFTAAGTSVFVHSSTSPNFERLSTLSSTDPNGHRKNINTLLLNPANPLQLITASDDGTVKLWDWVEGRLVRTVFTYTEGGMIRQICLAEVDDKWWIFATTSKGKKEKQGKDGGQSYKVMRFPLSTPQGETPYVGSVGKLHQTPSAIFTSPRNNYVVALAGNKAYVYRLPTNTTDDSWRPSCVKFVSDEVFTCGAFAPERRTRSGAEQEEWFATGDAKGVIRLWHGLKAAFRQLDGAAGSAQQSNTEKRLPTTSLHWHAHAVAAIAFTTTGAQILSVGEESVLVQWHLASGKREYIPRLGGRPILSVAVRPGARGVEEEYWMGFADGAMMRVGASTGSVASVGQGVRLDPLRPTSQRPYPLAVHPATKSLVVSSSHPSTLQFIDPLESSVLFDLEVAPSNRVSRRDDKELDPVAVEKVAFSAPRNGRSEWMATVEGRPFDENEGGGMVKTLKFWRWNGDRYIINTQYPRPHGTNDLTALSFSASPTGEPYAITACLKGTVKMWHVREARKSDQVYWSMRSTFSYRDLPVYTAGFSPDGSLVALVHGPVVTLWDTERNVFLRALESVIDARKLGFAGPEGRYVIVAGPRKGVAVWDLLSCELVQTLPQQPADLLVALPTGILAAHSSGPKAKGDTGRTDIAFLSPAGAPGRTVNLKVQLSVLAPLPSQAAAHLVGIAPTGEIYRFGELQKAAAPTARGIASATAPVRQATSIWQEMFGKDAFLDELSAPEEPADAPAAISALQRQAAGRPEAVFDGPSHTLPPVGLLFDAFMDELLAPRAPAEDGDVVMAEVEEGDVPTPSLALAADAVRAVTDKEMGELTGFFRDLRAGSAPAQPAPRPNKPKSRPNGLPNGHARDRAVSTPTKGSKKHRSAEASPATPATDDEPEVVDGKRKSKKRKAPRHSGV